MLNVLFLPAFDSNASLADYYFRSIWYLNPYRAYIEKVTMFLKGSLSAPKLPINFDPCIDALEPQMRQFYHLNGDHNDARVEKGANEADIVLVWNTNWLKGLDKHSRLRRILKNKRVFKVDASAERYGGSHFLRVGEAFREFRPDPMPESYERFGQMTKKCASQVGYIFGTGPSLKQALTRDFSDGTTIACNSMVNNGALMERLRPPIITMADPIFHAGCSDYAGAFRERLSEAAEQYDSAIVVPLRDYRLYRENLSEGLAERLIAIPFREGDTPNLDLSTGYYVTSTSNILTLFLIPLAATMFEEIRIMGCDGRPLPESSYFWGHDKQSQFIDKMEGVKKVHPAFFAIDYNDYYLTHCRVLWKWLDAAERVGKRVVNLSATHIPALSRRGPVFRCSDAGRGDCAPEISIIMPARNVAKYIDEAVASVRMQDHEDWELIAIDDHSSDATVPILEKYCRLDHRIRLLHNEGAGVSRARNQGIEAARGEFITFLDADDYMYPGALAARAQALRDRPGWSLVHCKTEITDENLRELGWRLDGRGHFDYRSMHRNPFHINAIMGRSPLIKKHRFDQDRRNGEDWLFWARIAREGHVFHGVPGGKVAYRLRPDSSVSSDMAEHEKALLSVIDWVYSPAGAREASAPEFCDGLTCPPKEQVVRKRYLNVLARLALEARTDDAIREAKHLSAEITREVDGVKSLEGRIRSVAMRYYRCRDNEIRARLQQDRNRSGILEAASAIAEHVPRFDEAFRKLADVKSAGGRGIRRRFKRLLDGRKRTTGWSGLGAGSALAVSAAVAGVLMPPAAPAALGISAITFMAALAGLFAIIWLTRKDARRRKRHDEKLGAPSQPP